MKKLILVFCVITLVASCERSTKGHWTKSDKENARKEIKKGLNTNSVASSMFTEKQIEQFCDCAIGKLEKKYNSFKDADNSSSSEVEKVGEECAYELLK